MPLDVDILASSQYLGLPRDEGTRALDDADITRAQRGLAAAVSRCQSYTRRTVQPLTTPAPGLALWGGTTHDPDATVHQVRARGSLLRVPDLRDLLYVDVLDGPYAGQLSNDDVELVRYGPAPTAVWVRLPFRPRDRPRVAITGKFGITPLPADLEDSLYTYAATRWYEASAQFSDRVDMSDGGELVLPRRLPTVVRGVWDEYRPPKTTAGAIYTGRG